MYDVKSQIFDRFNNFYFKIINVQVKVSSREEGGGTSGASTPTKQRTKMKTTTIISNNGAMVVNAPPELPFLSARGSEAVDVTRAKLTRQLAERTNLKMQVEGVEDVKNTDFISRVTYI